MSVYAAGPAVAVVLFAITATQPARAEPCASAACKKCNGALCETQAFGECSCFSDPPICIEYPGPCIYAPAPGDSFCPACPPINSYSGGGSPWADFNDDGYLDLAVGRPRDGSGGDVEIYYGTASGIPSWGSPTQRWDRDTAGVLGGANEDDSFGWAVAVGDFDGNGYDDLAIGVPGDDVSSTESGGSIHILYGSSSGLSADGDQIFHQDTTGVEGVSEDSDGYGSTLMVGDFNCDGFADIATGMPFEDAGAEGDSGAVSVLFGTNSGLSATGDVLFHQDTAGVEGASEEGDLFGYYLAVGNFNGDSANGNACDDLAVAAPFEAHSSAAAAGIIDVFMGGGAGLDLSGDQLWYQGNNGIQGAVDADDVFGLMSRALDINSDGYDDLTFDIPGDASRTVIFGSSSGLTGTNDVLTSQVGPVSFQFPHLPCAASGSDSECTCTSAWSEGNCTWVELACDSIAGTYAVDSGRYSCTAPPESQY